MGNRDSADILTVARRSKQWLEASGDRVAAFALGQMNGDGGFRGRSERSDLYYTAFGIDCVLAMDNELPARQIAEYLSGFGTGQELDLVHLACLARCLSRLGPQDAGGRRRASIVKNLEAYHRGDGGYSTSRGRGHGSCYGCFLAQMAYRDLGLNAPEPAGMLRCLRGLRTADGAYANEPNPPAGTTTATAAAVVLLRDLGGAPDAAAVQWLLSRCRGDGGFLAGPAAPIPDLLSTASTLYALSVASVPLAEIRQPCLDFIRSLWDERGAFCGSWADRTPDCEYTFYGLLAIGSLLGS